MQQYARQYLRWFGVLAALPVFGLLLYGALLCAQEEAPDPAEIVIGERLFLETRFAQFVMIALDTGQDVNTPLNTGDPVMEETVTTSDPLPGPFAGQSMNCRACHLVDEQVEIPSGGMRTYSDFARRSPVPEREDGKRVAMRNSPPLVNAALARIIHQPEKSTG